MGAAANGITAVEANPAIGDLPQSYQEVAEALGMDTALRLIDEFGGCAIYVPSQKTVTQPARRLAIRAEFDGTNILRLARKWGLSERHVRQLVTGKEAA